jgi:hypothetical protein
LLTSIPDTAFKDADGSDIYFTQNPGEVLVQEFEWSIKYNFSLGIEYIPAKLWTSVFGDDVLRQKWWDATGNLSHGNTLSLINLDGLAKSLYSIILTDLGQSVESNILAFPQRTMDFAKKTIQLGTTGDFIDLLITGPEPRNPPLELTAFYKWAGTGVPYVNSSVISTQYLCQVPKLKSKGSLIVSIIVADLVFLQALWVVFTWIVTFFLERRHPEAKYCPGCAVQLKSDEPETKMEFIASGSYKQLPNPVQTPTSPILPIFQPGPASIGSGSASIVSGSSVRRRNEETVQPLLPSP